MKLPNKNNLGLTEKDIQEIQDKLLASQVKPGDILVPKQYVEDQINSDFQWQAAQISQYQKFHFPLSKPKKLPPGFDPPILPIIYKREKSPNPDYKEISPEEGLKFMSDNYQGMWEEEPKLPKKKRLRKPKKKQPFTFKMEDFEE